MDTLIVLIAVVGIAFLVVRVLLRGELSLKSRGGDVHKLNNKIGYELAARNRHHAVTISPMAGGCEAAENLPARRYLVDEAPLLPLPECTKSRCDCRYIHHQDRRSPESERRRPHGAFVDTALLRDIGERRSSRGRRREDWAAA